MHPVACNFVLCALFLRVGFLSISLPANAQNVAALSDRLKQTSAESSLDLPGTNPWHLKLDVQLFDPKGAPNGQGTVEEWWADRAHYRISYTSPAFTGTELHLDEKIYRTTGSDAEPGLYDDLLDQVVHPLRYDGNPDDGKPDLRKQTFVRVPLECIMLDQPLTSVSIPPLGLFPTFCLDPGKPSLRIAVETGSLIFIRNHIGTFLGRSVPVDLMAQSAEVKLATAHISALSTMKVEAMDLKPSEDLSPVGSGIAHIEPGVMAGNILTKTQPIYPQRAKEKHVSGTVVLHATIGRDGRPRSLRVVSTPDSNLAIAALQAVKYWTYKPYMLNGLPVNVDTAIAVNFSFRPG